MKLILCDTNKALCYAWQSVFSHEKDVEIINSNFEDVESYDCIVSLGNSFGLMDGGIDAAIIDCFGTDLMLRVQNKIKKEYYGEQPVGTCLIVKTGNKAHPYLAHTPTMRIPHNISGTDNVYNAMRAMLIATKKNGTINTVLCPGLGTCTGMMLPEIAAACMYLAYQHVINPQPINWKNAVDTEIALRGVLCQRF